MKVDMRQFLESFFDEASEHIENMEAALLQLESTPDDTELLNTIFRAAHSIKGASSTFGVQGVGEFTHVLESLLDRMRDGEIQVTSETTEVLLASVDVLSGLLSAARDGTPEPTNTAEVIARLEEINGGKGAESASEQSTVNETTDESSCKYYAVKFRPSVHFYHLGLDPLLLLRDLEECGEVSELELDVSELPSISEMDPESSYLGWTLNLETERDESVLRDVFMFVDDETTVEFKVIEKAPEIPEASASSESEATSSDVAAGKSDAKASPAKASGAPQRESVRVNGERLDSMINQIGELVIGISMVEQEWASVSGGTDSPAIVQLSKIVRDLQEQSLSLRMVPVAATFQKMARIVRDLSNRLGKKINFEVSGEETELDKTVVDQIGDPLIHMIRNSVDHGIETPEERIAAGKPAEGHILVRAYHQGGNIYIELKDDGKGMDLNRIRQKAIDRGIVSPDEKLSSQEICELVFHAGLSTAEKVTDVSGRGVGMDVVRRNIEALKGSVTLNSEPGKGTVVTVRLPLTLAILDGLLISLGSEVYVIPLLSVVESFRPRRSEIKRLANNMDVVQVRGEVVPILQLHSILNLTEAQTDPCQGLLVIVEDHDTKFALLVDDLIGQQQAVIKNLEANFRKVEGIAGATILGDGRVALILDIVSLKSLTA
ncbi:chemotaxis protein CheA [Roseiconus lacunae]|uniref:chemotaxis protein CheA n=1 Tax=Roseiconus lacunae TaxID=2605694 RepID=UPI001E61ABB4|nr:chemotaxis protein CheA [Roseiconus lacunae]MCD0460981.1 chemotaxis protein CheA [Roseiconus lacunae]